MQVLGGAPGTRETDLLEPHNSVETVNAIVLSGGSAFGLDAASGVQAALREAGIGFDVGGHRIPIVPAAILFDLRNGGDKDWGRYPPYRELGYDAAQAASLDFAIGTAGAGTGALTAGLKGGLGSASTMLASGITIGALAAANPTGSVTVGRSRHFWAAPFEIGDEFGGLGYPSPMPLDARRILLKFRDRSVGANTTIAVIATDAILTKPAAKRLAIAAHDGFVAGHMADPHAGRWRSGLRACDRQERQDAFRRRRDRSLRSGRRDDGAGHRARRLRRHADGRRSHAGLVGASELTRCILQVGSDCSSSNVTATSELADSRTLLPSTSATSAVGM